MKRSSKLVLELLGSETNGLTRAEIRRRTGLSKPTVQSIVSELRDTNRIVDVGVAHAPQARHAHGGRPAERFALTAAAGLVIGVDVGHGHIRVAVADRSGGLVGTMTEDTSVDIDRLGIAALENVVQLIDDALATSEHSIAMVQALTIGIPAAIDRSGTVLFSDSLPSWATVDIGAELFRLLRKRFDELRIGRDMVRVENDANLGAVGEGCQGAALGARHYIYVKVSTGIGMGVVLRGSLYRGAEGAAGEFGHTTISPMAAPFLRSAAVDLSPCPRCSKLDCLENLASGQAILRLLDTARPRSTCDRHIERVIDLAKSDAVRFRRNLQAIVDAGTLIGYTLADVVRLYAPEVVVIGGLLAEAGDALLKPVKDAVASMKGLPAVKIRPVQPARIRRSEIDGALAIAASTAARAGRL